jgi:hypothetical protein
MAFHRRGGAVRVSLSNDVRIEVPGLVDAEQWRVVLDSLGQLSVQIDRYWSGFKIRTGG